MRVLLMACLLGGCSSSADGAEVDAAPETIVALDAPSTEDTAAADSTFAETAADTTPADTTADIAFADSATDDTSDSGGIHYDPTVFALVSKSCATTGCHIGTAAAGSLGLADAKKGYDALMGPSEEMPTKKLVVPFNPSASWLVSKPDHAMPPITSADKKLFVTWIEQGALY